MLGAITQYLIIIPIFFIKGWSGVNIDLDYDCINLFKKFRNTDFNINCALSSTDGYLFIFLSQ